MQLVTPAARARSPRAMSSAASSLLVTATCTPGPWRNTPVALLSRTSILFERACTGTPESAVMTGGFGGDVVGPEAVVVVVASGWRFL